MENKKFDIQYSYMFKGIAVLMLLLHHILNSKYSFTSIIPPSILAHLVSCGKVCVSIFFFLSAYGLEKSYEKLLIHKWKADLYFAGKHVVKLLLSFWCVYFTFVPLSVFFHYSFVEIYSRSGNIFINMLSDMLGMAYIFGTPSVNNTWWYLGVSLIFYVVSPIIFRIINNLSKWSYLVFGLMAVICTCGYYGYKGLLVYFIPYFMGAIVAKENLLEKMVLDGKNNFRWEILKQALMVTVAVSVVFIREWYWQNDLKNYRLDWIIAFVLIYIVYFYSSIDTILSKSLVKLGHESGNIFFFHSFLYAFWFTDLLYGRLKYGIIIYAAFLIICYFVSRMIENLKRKAGFERLVNSFLKSASKTVIAFGVVVLLFLMIRSPYLIAYFSVSDLAIQTKEAPIKESNSRRIEVTYKMNTDLEDFLNTAWKSSDSNIVKVSADGVITAVNKGEAYITFTAGAKEVRYKVHVN